jgi:hypothetical protein
MSKTACRKDTPVAYLLTIHFKMWQRDPKMCSKNGNQLLEIKLVHWQEAAYQLASHTKAKPKVGEHHW